MYVSTSARTWGAVALAAAICGVVGAHAADRYWVVGDGDWDTSTANWHTGSSYAGGAGNGGGSTTFTTGDDCYFGSDNDNRSRWNIVTIDAGGVSPGFLQVQQGYGVKVELTGGDLTGTFDMRVNNQNALRFTRAFSFDGTLALYGNDVNNNTAKFHFEPTAAATLTTDLDIPAGLTGELYGNANADWSGSTMTMGAGGGLVIPDTDGIASHYSGLVVTLEGDAQLTIEYHYNDSGRGCFNGRFDGSSYFLTISEGSSSSNQKNYITGPGEWNIAGLIFNQPGFKCDIQAPNICGGSLNVQAGTMILAAGTTQEVSALTITGVVQSAFGTYGSTASGADYPIDAHFEGGGVVLLAAGLVPEVTLTANDDSASEAGPDPGQFTVTRDDTSGDLDVFYAVSGTAEDSDYDETLSGSVTIGNGDATATIDITPTDDSTGEYPETVTLTLQPNAAYSLGTPSNATVTIADDDVFLPTLTLVTTDAWGAESGNDPAVLTVTRDATTPDLTVYYTVAGSADAADYSETLGSVVIADGDASADITITPVNDGDVEPLESVAIALATNASYILGSPTNDTVQIADDDGALGNRYWAVGDENWDTNSANWASSGGGARSVTFRDGDAVYFSGSIVAARQFNEVTLAHDVAPASLQVEAGYGTGASLDGADLTGAFDAQVGNQNVLRFRRAFSFDGTITLNGSSSDATFYFEPSSPATLTQDIVIPAAGNGVIYGNADADWSGCGFTLSAGALLQIPSTGGVVSNYSGLVVTMVGDAEMTVAYNYQDSGRGCFNGRVVGPQYTLTIDEPTQDNNRWNYIAGPGDWNIGKLVFSQPGFSCDIRASNICGDALDLQDGTMDLGPGTVQTVKALTVGGDAKTVYGTYGSTLSGADFPDDTHFAGLGVVEFVQPSGTFYLMR